MSIFLNEFVNENKKEIEIKKLKEEYGIVLEAFFGKKPNILKIEKAFDSILKKYGNPLDVMKITNCEELKTIKKCIKDEFGFKDVGFMFDYMNNIKNGATVPLTVTMTDPKPFQRKKSIEASKSGFRFTKEAQMCFVMIFYPGIFDQNPDHGAQLTGAELTAMMLHEIGHNFTCGVSNKYKATAPFLPAMEMFGYILKTIGDLATLNIFDVGNDAAMLFYSRKQANDSVEYIATKYEKELKKELDQMKKEDPEAYKEFIDAINQGLQDDVKNKKISRTVNRLFGLIILPIRFVQNVVNLLFNTLTRHLGYLDERFADSFAAMYGYGAEQVSVLNKLTYGDYEILSYDRNIPVIGHFMNLVYLIPNAVYGSFDEHPNMPARYTNIKKQMERDLNDPRVDEDTKKIIRKQIAKADQVMDESYKQFVKIQNVKNPAIIQRAFDYLLCVSLGGDLRHNYKGSDIYDDIDDMVYGRGED